MHQHGQCEQFITDTSQLFLATIAYFNRFLKKYWVLSGNHNPDSVSLSFPGLMIHRFRFLFLTKFSIFRFKKVSINSIEKTVLVSSVMNCFYINFVKVHPLQLQFRFIRSK